MGWIPSHNKYIYDHRDTRNNNNNNNKNLMSEILSVLRYYRHPTGNAVLAL